MVTAQNENCPIVWPRQNSPVFNEPILISQFSILNSESSASPMKNRLTSLAILSLALAFAACNKSDSGAGGGSGGATSLTIGVAFETLQTEGWVAGFEKLKIECARQNIKMLEAIADGDANRQFEQVRNFINRKVDGIIIAPKDAKTII